MNAQQSWVGGVGVCGWFGFRGRCDFFFFGGGVLILQQIVVYGFFGALLFYHRGLKVSPPESVPIRVQDPEQVANGGFRV